MKTLAALALVLFSIPVAHAAGGATQLKFDGGRLTLPQSSPWGALAWKDRCGGSTRICADSAAAGGVQLYLLGGRITPEEAGTELKCEPGATLDAAAQLCTRIEGEDLTVMKRMGSIAVAISITSAKSVSTASIRGWMQSLQWEGK